MVVDDGFVDLEEGVCDGGAVESVVSRAWSNEADDLWLCEIFDFDDLLFVFETVGLATLERLTSSMLTLWASMRV